MMLPVDWLAEAIQDYEEAWAWYESIRPALAARFALAAEQTTLALGAHPLRFPSVTAKLRRAPIQDFPYMLFYNPEPTRVLLVACLHAKRHPRMWQERTV